jgi:hypothetical protein
MAYWQKRLTQSNKEKQKNINISWIPPGFIVALVCIQIH